MIRAKTRPASDEFLKQANLNAALVSRGIQAFLVQLLIHNTKKQKAAIELFEQNFENMKEFRKNIKDDKERLCNETKGLVEEELENELLRGKEEQDQQSEIGEAVQDITE